MNRYKVAALIVSLLAPLTATAVSVAQPNVIFLLFVLQGMPLDPRLTPITALVLTVGLLLGLDFIIASAMVL